MEKTNGNQDSSKPRSTSDCPISCDAGVHICRVQQILEIAQTNLVA